ncbi:MAG: hypothetical protein WA151_02215 [Desulfatirhabdiaceae bacterium]
MDVEKEIHKPQMMAMVPTDVQCMVGILASDLKLLHKAMNLCTNAAPLKNDEEKAAWAYFTGSFYAFLDEAIKDMSGGPNGK